jgi:hypothetical protein
MSAMTIRIPRMSTTGEAGVKMRMESQLPWSTRLLSSTERLKDPG